MISLASIVDQQCGFFLLPFRGFEGSTLRLLMVLTRLPSSLPPRLQFPLLPLAILPPALLLPVAAVDVLTIAPAMAAAASSGAAAIAPRRCFRASAGGSLISPAVTGRLFATRDQLEVWPGTSASAGAEASVRAFRPWMSNSLLARSSGCPSNREATNRNLDL